MPKSRGDVVKVVEKVVPKELLHRLRRKFKRKERKLWGLKRGRSRQERAVDIALYKDITAKGYNTLAAEIKHWNYHSGRTLRHNQSIIRSFLCRWAGRKIKIGDVNAWDSAARRCHLPPLLKDVNLWVDSTDIPLAGSQYGMGQHPDYSHKLKKLGRKFFSIHDAERRVRLLTLGTTPKLYDGHWLESNKEVIKRKFKDGVFIGDLHFAVGKEFGPEVTFRIRETKEKRVTITHKGFKSPKTAKQKKYNKQHAKARSRVESPYGEWKRSWNCLATPWKESKDELDKVVRFAAAVHNYRL